MAARTVLAVRPRRRPVLRTLFRRLRRALAEIRETNAGTRYPPPEGELARARFVAAGFPDYPWLFATDGEFAAFASVLLGQFEPIEEHMRALRRASLIDTGGAARSSTR